MSNVKVGGGGKAAPDLEENDGMDPFSSPSNNKAAEAILREMGLGLSAGSPQCSLDYTRYSVGSSGSSRRSSIQLPGQRHSVDQGPSSQAALLHQRSSFELASAELNLQKLQLAAANAQYQLNQATQLHQLTTALTQIQLGSMLMPDPQLLMAQQLMLQQEPLGWNGPRKRSDSGRDPTLSMPLELDALNPYNSYPTTVLPETLASESPRTFISPWASLPQHSSQDLWQDPTLGQSRITSPGL